MIQFTKYKIKTETIFEVLIASARRYRASIEADAHLTSTIDFIIEKRPCYQISKPLHFSSSFDIVLNLCFPFEQTHTCGRECLPFHLLFYWLSHWLLFYRTHAIRIETREEKKKTLLRTEFNWDNQLTIV